MILQRKKELFTDEKYGKRPEERTKKELLDSGIVIIDKPSGPASHSVSTQVAKILKIKKTGHLGTLDQKATGVLPVLLGRATSCVHFFQYDKEYVCTMEFKKSVAKNKLEQTLKKFIGEITQIPPPYAAVAKRPRKRKIHFLEILEFTGKKLKFHIKCQAGTYIATLCSDIGKEMNMETEMKNLRRTKVGKWSEKEAISLRDLSKKHILPMEEAIEIKKVWIADSAIEAICSGAQLMVPGILKTEQNIKIGEIIAILSLKDELVAFGEAQMISEEMVTEKKGTAAKIKRVIMKRGTYPKGW